MADGAGEKTEKPSAKRLKDARERGQVAISRDVSTALGSRAGIDTVKAILTGAVLSVLAWRVGTTLVADAGRLTWASPVSSAHRGWTDALRLLWQAGFALLAIGTLDFGVQKWRLMSSLRM